MPAVASQLGSFVAALPEAQATTLRTLAHAWEGGGGRLAVGTVAIRLQFGPEETPHTAGTLFAKDTRLELARIILEHHGLDADAWTHWSDEFADLAHHGFDASSKFPTLPLQHITATELARLVTGLRDLATMVGQ